MIAITNFPTARNLTPQMLLTVASITNFILKLNNLFQMSSFPPLNWEVRFIEDMDKIFLDEGSSTLSVAALLAVKPARGAEGDFRFILMGSDPICARVKAS